MKQGKEVENPESRFFAVLLAAAKLPGVRIHRQAYLRSALARHCSEEEIRRAIEETPAAAGITVDVLEKAANDSIRYETAKVEARPETHGHTVSVRLPLRVSTPSGYVADLSEFTHAGWSTEGKDPSGFGTWMDGCPISGEEAGNPGSSEVALH